MAKENSKAQIKQDALDLAFLIYDIFMEEEYIKAKDITGEESDE